MAKIKFYLRDLSQKETAIYIRLRTGITINKAGQRVYQHTKFYINETIAPDLWDLKTCRAKKTKTFPQYPEFNKKLDDIESQVSTILYQLQNNGIEITPLALKTEIDKLLKPDTIKPTTTSPVNLFEFIEHFISTSTHKAATIKSYRLAQNNLIEYQKKNSKDKLTFERIDIDFYNSFIEFLRKKNYATNTIGTRIKVLKTILGNAQERDIEVNEDYKKRAFKKPKEDTDHIYLTEAELKKLYRIEMQPGFNERLKEKHGDILPEYLDRAKDIFLIGSYTGLRFSDLSRLKRENIHSDNTITIKTQKTEQIVVIPIHPIVKNILEKYAYQLPKIPTNQKFNEFIKEVGRLAGINEKIGTEITKGGFKVRESIEKHKLIASHTARRSFATNAYLADMPSISIMKITGHKTESAFMKYIKMSAKDNAIKMQMHPFFRMAVVE